MHKSITPLLVVGLLLFLHFPLYAQSGESIGWRLFDTDDDYYMYYDSLRIQSPREGIVRIWLKTTPNPYRDSRARVQYEKARKREQAGLDGTPWMKWDREIVLWEIDCTEQRVRILSMVDYDESGRVIETNDEISAWSHVVPESRGEALVILFCRYRR